MTIPPSPSESGRHDESSGRSMPSPTPPLSEVATSREVVRALLREQHPDLADREITDPVEGFDMAVFRLGEDLAVRLPRHREAVASLAVEVRWVRELSEGWTFPTQRIVRTGVPSEVFPWNWAVTSWLPGRIAARHPLDASAAPDLGRALVEIHRPAPADAPFDVEQSIRLAERDPVLRRFLRTLPAVGAGRGPMVAPGAVEELWGRALAVPDDAPRVWIHGDLHPFNVISDEGRFGGIIDWSDIARGDPAVDLGFLWLLLRRDAVGEAYRAYGGLDEATEARARGIGLVKAVTLAAVPKAEVARIGWRALTELGVAVHDGHGAREGAGP
ncbi:MAG TPA: aminoglycoside phosphotransferase family protein [Nocardiopsis listeri]|uniref:aminoglycoside phosphotransferase family protein n=1 Tax=Nocardiopsis listeri TaxID=53440 RepID=UPI001D33ABCD|nr:aminoglycoside phosphotransferase family protein [Nocardiopsis listeri]HJE59662.1 aminoglycoside phosphotransferase family protein [Nocardiopsis listeri]